MSQRLTDPWDKQLGRENAARLLEESQLGGSRREQQQGPEIALDNSLGMHRSTDRCFLSQVDQPIR